MKDYWDFAAIARSFQATGYGRIVKIDGNTWRVRGGDYVLLSRPRPGLVIPAEANPKRTRSMTWCDFSDEVPYKKDGYSSIVERDWDWRNFPQCRRALSKGEREGVTCGEGQIDSLLYVSDRWVEAKREHDPHALIRKGHHQAMIDDPGMEFVQYKLGYEVIGAVGWAIEGKQAAVGFVKHLYEPWWVSKYIWVHAINLLREQGVIWINAGSSTKLKDAIGMTRVPQYRVDFSQVEQAKAFPKKAYLKKTIAGKKKAPRR